MALEGIYALELPVMGRIAAGVPIELVVRGKPVPAEIVPMPFVKHAYYRG